jgi:hypothetical protein
VIAKLDKLRAEGHDPATLIDTAIERGWQSVFAPNSPPVRTGGDEHSREPVKYPQW